MWPAPPSSTPPSPPPSPAGPCCRVTAVHHVTLGHCNIQLTSYSDGSLGPVCSNQNVPMLSQEMMVRTSRTERRVVRKTSTMVHFVILTLLVLTLLLMLKAGRAMRESEMRERTIPMTRSQTERRGWRGQESRYRRPRVMQVRLRHRQNRPTIIPTFTPDTFTEGTEMSPVSIIATQCFASFLIFVYHESVSFLARYVVRSRMSSLLIVHFTPYANT